VGAISDQAARALSGKGAVYMSCIAAIGAKIEDITQKARAAVKIVAIDGCSGNCSKIILKQEGFGAFGHICLEDLGMEKGKTPISEERVSWVAAKAAEALGL